MKHPINKIQFNIGDLVVHKISAVVNSRSAMSLSLKKTL